MLNDLLDFLKDKGIEVPEGATQDQIIALLTTLLEADGGEGDKEEQPKPTDETKPTEQPKITEENKPQGVA